MTASNSKRVLIVDDETSIVAYLTAILEDEGYETAATTNAQEARDLAREQRPDLISLDIMMPKRSGIALYQEFKLDQRLRDVPIIFVSAFSRTSDFGPSSFRRLVPDERIPFPDAYLEKPIRVPEFLDTVAGLVGTPGRQEVDVDE